MGPRRDDGPSNRAGRREAVDLAVAPRPDRLPQGARAASHHFRRGARGAFGRGGAACGADLAQDSDQAQGRYQARGCDQASRKGGGEGHGGSLLRRGSGDPCPSEGRNPRTRAARQGNFQQNGAALDSGSRPTVFAEAVVSGPEDRPLFRGGVFPRPRRTNPAGLADRIEGRRSADVAMERWSDHIPWQKSSGGGERSPDRACTCNGKDPGCRWRANAHVTPYTVLRAIGEGGADGAQGPHPRAYSAASGRHREGRPSVVRRHRQTVSRHQPQTGSTPPSLL